jgi:hypothetical protein
MYTVYRSDSRLIATSGIYRVYYMYRSHVSPYTALRRHRCGHGYTVWRSGCISIFYHLCSFPLLRHFMINTSSDVRVKRLFKKKISNPLASCPYTLVAWSNVLRRSCQCKGLRHLQPPSKQPSQSRPRSSNILSLLCPSTCCLSRVPESLQTRQGVYV